MSNPDTALHSYAYLILRATGRTFSALSDGAGCSPQTVKEVLLGQRKSRRIQEDIAARLGFGSWEQFSSEAQRFYEDFRSRLSEVRVCG